MAESFLEIVRRRPSLGLRYSHVKEYQWTAIAHSMPVPSDENWIVLRAKSSKNVIKARNLLFAPKVVRMMPTKSCLMLYNKNCRFSVTGLILISTWRSLNVNRNAGKLLFLVSLFSLTVQMSPGDSWPLRFNVNNLRKLHNLKFNRIHEAY